MLHTGECGVFGSITIMVTVMVQELSIKTIRQKMKRGKKCSD